MAAGAQTTHNRGDLKRQTRAILELMWLHFLSVSIHMIESPIRVLKKIGSSFICAVVAYIAMPNAQAQNMALVKTDSGCGLYTNTAQADVLRKIASGELTWHWEGECIGGLAQGLGTSKLAYVSQSINSSYSTRQHFHAGYPVGYGRYTVTGNNFSAQSWVFNFQEKMVGFNGLGLVGNDS